ncbi:FecR family protein [Mucilaginibacter sp. E4BP6]|uniref:FecR family protein n=1 Tax=Mucilaginibacter sp. E4BP6 TaxID=2723089 RepID=UPI0017DBAD6A|nr:FecR domain-containing protein [Mucilaginibacter sp. E4BP6]NYE67000.1 hypothetical protein [Mucilaginibacter sp. E4BP6]
MVESWHLRDVTARTSHTPDADEISAVHIHMREVIQLHAGTPQRIRSWQRIAAAACFLFISSIGGYFFVHQQQKPQLVKNQVHDILPGTDKATLTLANGKRVLLTKAFSGTVAQQGSMQVKLHSGLISYLATNDNATSTGPIYNTLTTARKEQFPLVLSDGTKVWLNSVSSITYPVIFTGKERVVKITGEAYFEVAHNKDHPFKVTVDGQTVEDIGTAFNINAYNDEPVIRTTLVTGSVKVTEHEQSVLLNPGYAASTRRNSHVINVSAADIEEAIAWKNGETLFNDEDLPTIMRQVSRWYDVDVTYEGQLPPWHFAGGISRKSKLSSLLKILELNNIHFTVTGNKITVHP